MAHTPPNPANFRYQDPHWEDHFGPVPPWTPDSHKPWKPGQNKGAWIWPRDKPLRNDSPLASKRRWLDVMTGKGPGIFIGNRTRFGPTRATWSNWTTPAEVFDSLGYRDEHRSHIGLPGQDAQGRYDFKKRRYTRDWQRPDVWSDVKWGRGSNNPLFVRDGWGREMTHRNGLVLPFDNTERGNDFRYRFHTDHFDWARPEPDCVYEPLLHV